MCSSLARRALSSDARVLRDVALRRSAARSFDASRTVPDATKGSCGA